ncbi:metallopeptidase family protein [Candidatus Saccharibacteria bacterium]|nr:metallopeptidase family protein [Candidatus Saccharibacteria bacterium]
MNISDQEFSNMINEALASLPAKYTRAMNNVAIVYEDEPTEKQREKMQLRDNQTLFGLYEGIPMPQRGAGYNLVLPDKITIFKNPIVQNSQDIVDLKKQIRHTLWHEIAHHFGLDHDQIHKLDGTAQTE